MPGASQETGPVATTEVAEVRTPDLASGGPGMLTYEVTHEALGHVPTGERLPGAVVPRTPAFDGLWGEAGYLGAWLAPPGPFRFQFDPASTLIENGYFTNRLRSGADALPLEDGDRFELAMGNLSWDAPLPLDRERGVADGRLAWDASVDVRELTARMGDETGEMQALLVRADIVARGGDVDARARAEQVPPLTIDLPQTYPQATGMYIVTTIFPYTQYVAGMDMRVLPATGKAVLSASVRGYLQEARETTLPGGASIKEWHLPLHAVILLSHADDAAGAATVQLPQEGVAVVGDDTGSRRIELSGGDRLAVGTDLDISVDEAATAPAGSSSPSLEELAAASAVDHTLAEPVELAAGDGRLGVTIDPDHRGAGLLGLRSPRRSETGTTFAHTSSVPIVVVDGDPILLDRSRLTDLRVLPVYDWIGIGLTGAGAQTPLVKTRTVFGWARRPGLTIDAAYDLGEGRYAFLRTVSAPGTSAPSLLTTVTVRSLANEPIAARAVQHLEVPAGDVAHAGEPRVAEFEGALDASGDATELTVGGRRLTASAGGLGVVTALGAPPPLAADPGHDPSAALGDGPVHLVFRPDATVAPAAVRSIATRVTLTSEPGPEPLPPPIGTPCGAPQAADLPVPDAPPGLDVVDAWLDADDANLYATIRLRSAPAAVDGALQRFSLHWRAQHSGRFARASLASDGTWTFEHGGYNNGWFGPTAVPGEVSGTLVRIAVPLGALGYRVGEVIDDTGAFAWVETGNAAIRVDDAPDDADPTWGTGGTYRVGTCG